MTPAGQAARHLSADCVGGRSAVANAAIDYGERGNEAAGDEGRFSLIAFTPDAFLTVPVDEPAADRALHEPRASPRTGRRDRRLPGGVVDDVPRLHQPADRGEGAPARPDAS